MPLWLVALVTGAVLAAAAGGLAVMIFGSLH
jgi:hypothetical protein